MHVRCPTAVENEECIPSLRRRERRLMTRRDSPPVQESIYYILARECRGEEKRESRSRFTPWWHFPFFSARHYPPQSSRPRGTPGPTFQRRRWRYIPVPDARTRVYACVCMMMHLELLFLSLIFFIIFFLNPAVLLSRVEIRFVSCADATDDDFLESQVIFHLTRCGGFSKGYNISRDD